MSRIVSFFQSLSRPVARLVHPPPILSSSYHLSKENKIFSDHMYRIWRVDEVDIY